MIRVHILVEGQTEETFIRDTLTPYYDAREIYFKPILARTSPSYKGGIVSYEKVKNQLTKLCRQDRLARVTTMIDFYGLPVGFPGMGDQHYPIGAAPVDQVTFLEQTLAADINESNFIPYFMLHEYEAILFCGPEKFRDWLDGDSEKAVQELTAIRSAFASPEDINNNPQTAPSKRIQAVLPRYKKTLHGPIIAADIGLDAIRRQCRHFDHWLKSIKSLAHS